MRREQQPGQDANKNETEKVADIPPGLGGTNVRFPSKFLNIWSDGFLKETTTFKIVEKLLQKKQQQQNNKKRCFLYASQGENLWIP